MFYYDMLTCLICMSNEVIEQLPLQKTGSTSFKQLGRPNLCAPSKPGATPKRNWFNIKFLLTSNFQVYDLNLKVANGFGLLLCNIPKHYLTTKREYILNPSKG